MPEKLYSILPELCPANYNWDIRFLARAMEMMDKTDIHVVPPLVRIMEIFQEGFADGVSINPIHCISAPHCDSILNFFAEVRDLQEKIRTQDLIIYEHNHHISYLALELRDFPGVSPGFMMLLWRSRSIFTSDDIVTARLIIKLALYKFGMGPKSSNEKRSSSLCTLPVSLQSQALDLVPESVILCSNTGRILGCNLVAQKTLYETIGSLITYSDNAWISHAFHPDDVDAFNKLWEKTREEKTSHRERFRIRSHGDKYRRFSWRISPVILPKEGDEERTLWVLVGIDLEEGDAAEEFKQLAELKSRFFAEISHEIRTPLSCILGTASLLSHTSLEPDQKELSDTIVISSKQLSNLVSNVLDMSRIEENKLKIEYSHVNFSLLMDEIIDIFKTDMVKAKIEFVYFIDKSIPEWIEADELRLRQVLTNLIGNSIKFSNPSMAIAVTASMSMIDGENILQFVVEDEGIGISEVTAKALFQNYSQAELSQRKFGGSGLGLVISKKLIKAMGGDISFSSVVGEGTTFTFTIKVPESEVKMETIKGPIFDSGTGDIKVNVAHPKLKKYIISCLENKQFNVTKDVIIMDAQYLETTFVAERCKLVLSFDTTEGEFINESMRFLRKPFKPNQLISSLNSFLEPRLPVKKSIPVQPVNSIASNLRILVAEDNEMNQELMNRVLKKLGCVSVQIAANGLQAVSLVADSYQQKNPYDLVFMDMLMPEMSGCEATIEIRKNSWSPHIVALTANAFTEDRELCLRSGMCDYAAKPVKWETMESILQKAHHIKNGDVDCNCSTSKISFSGKV